MLRTKQAVQFSQNARSFFISGSRSSTADGSPCTGPEDDKCVPRNQQRNDKILQPQKTSFLASNTLAKAGTVPYGDGILTFGRYKAENGVCTASVAQVLSAPSSSPRSHGESVPHGDVNAKRKVVYSSVLATHNSVKPGVAAVGSLANLVNSKPPVSDRNGKILTPHSGMVDTIRPTSNIGSSQKPLRRENSKSHEKPSAQIGGRLDATTQFNVPKVKAQKYVSGKPMDHVSSKLMESSVGSYNVLSDTTEQKQYLPQGTKSNSQRFVSKSTTQSSESKVNGVSSEGITSADNVQKPQRYTKMRTKTAALGGKNLVEHVYHILEQVKWGPAAEAALDNLNCTLGVYHGNQILKRLQDHTVARGFFYWLKRQPGFKHDEHSYTTMVGILGRARQFNAINSLLDEMVEDGSFPNVVTYNRMIHSYGRANYLDEALNVFYQMQEAGCEPDRVTYCTLIDIHAKAGFLDVALNMYRRMQEAGLSPDTFTYSVIINCLGKAGHLDTSYQLFSEMIAQGCTPNLVTYNIMIALQAKARNYPCALRLYRDMQTAGFEPDKVTYSIVMEVLGHCGYLEEAEGMFTEMKQRNWVPDEPVYGLLVDLWGKAGEVDKARGWYQAMIQAGVRPNVPTCNSLLSAFLRVHRFSDAYDVLQSMPSLGLNPSLQTYTLLLSCCTDTQYLSNMGVCCELMAISGHPAHAFLKSMPAAGPDGQNVREHANSFLDLMHSEDRESKRGLVDAVVDFLHKTGLKEEASSVWEVAAQKNVYPDVVREKSSLYWLINLHVMSDGTAITALARTLAWFRRQILMSGAVPMRIDIVTGWGRRSRVTGSSLVRQSVKEMLNIFEFPFYTESGNTGCFVGCGESLNTWLLHPYVERMHLL
ncbi:hypothetical protein AQUCO_00200450v1 [Aquilegia coerulea]|uniref:Smr domain-containing protein n=1 Tax=Aquilegia coerulea TaxID=218851 RepID=A0A2G5F3C0_AQUCA|nr:hypothetical protein AQUCO_00200450v1 [Aquilegia coerulea]